MWRWDSPAPPPTPSFLGLAPLDPGGQNEALALASAIFAIQGLELIMAASN